MREKMQENMQEDGGSPELTALWGSYRKACPETDAQPNFMPGLWQRIEERRKKEAWIFRWANAFAATAAVVALVSGAMFYSKPAPVPQRAYIEKLTEEINEDYFLATGYSARYGKLAYVNAALEEVEK
ncbi:MAG: hypothetical protein NW208_11425 [Bryobacter sp.]|nr:hypothetical protein [Bryobacter sp.]